MTHFYLLSAQSNHINKARLRVLQERQQVVDSLFEETRQRIHDIANDEEKYAGLIEALILQGAYTLMEPEVTVRCREADVDMANFAAERVAQKYEEVMRENITIKVSDDYLPASW